MSGIAPGPDPSMEDILASIRRILDEDQPLARPAESPPPPDVDDELMLDDSMLVGAGATLDATGPIEQQPPPPLPPQEVMAPIETDPAPVAAAIAAMPDPAPPHTPMPVHEAPAMTHPDLDPAPPQLMGDAASDTAVLSMSSLMRAVAADRGTAVRSDGPTIEDVVRETLRPLLKDWLDTHLPPLVERLVQAEIARVVARAAG